MTLRQLLTYFALSSFIALGATSVFAEESEPMPDPEMDEMSEEDGEPGNDFSSREDLIDFLSQANNSSATDSEAQVSEINDALDELNMDDPAATDALEDLRTGKEELMDAEAALAEAEAAEDADAIEEANSDITAAEEKIAMAEEELVAINEANSDLLDDLNAAESDLAEAQSGNDEIAAVVEEMSDDQVYWSNQKFQNAKASGLVVDIPLEELEKFTTYNFHQINSATKAYEAEAKFVSIAEKFDEDSKQFEMFTEKSESQRDKFLAKVERFSDEDPVTDEYADAAASMKHESKSMAKVMAATAAKSTAKNEGKGAAKSTAKAEAKHAAKGQARNESKGVAKAAAKLAAKDAAKQSAKATAKQIVQEEGKAAGKSHGKENSKNAAKDNAKDNAKKSGKGNV